MDGFAYEISRASGPSVANCCVIAHRYDERDGCFRPGFGESWIIAVSPESAKLHIGGHRWFSGIWRAPSGAIFAADARSGICHLPSSDSEDWTVTDLGMTIAGLWGLDEHNIWAWGTKGEAHALSHWDGKQWLAVESPGPIVAIHGHSPELIFAVGHQGFISRWDGQRWIDMASPTSETIHGVHVVSKDQVYGICPSGRLLQGSILKWRERLVVDHSIHSVTVFDGDVFVGASFPEGLMRLEENELVPFQRDYEPVQMSADDELLVVSPHGVFSSSNGTDWRGFNTDLVGLILKG